MDDSDLNAYAEDGAIEAFYLGGLDHQGSAGGAVDANAGSDAGSVELPSGLEEDSVGDDASCRPPSPVANDGNHKGNTGPMFVVTDLDLDHHANLRVPTMAVGTRYCIVGPFYHNFVPPNDDGESHDEYNRIVKQKAEWDRQAQERYWDYWDNPDLDDPPEFEDRVRQCSESDGGWLNAVDDEQGGVRMGEGWTLVRLELCQGAFQCATIKMKEYQESATGEKRKYFLVGGHAFRQLETAQYWTYSYLLARLELGLALGSAMDHADKETRCRLLKNYGFIPREWPVIRAHFKWT